MADENVETDSAAGPLAGETPLVGVNLQPLTVEEVLNFSVDELKAALSARGLQPSGNKAGLQVKLLQATVMSTAHASEVADTHNSVCIDGDDDDVADNNTDNNSNDSNSKSTSSNKNDETAYEFQLRIKQLELEAEERKMRLQLEEKSLQMQHELQLRKLELQNAAEHATIAPSSTLSSNTHVFRVDTAVKLVPKFNERDIDSFLLTFERIASLNNWPKNQYSAVLQALLTGKAQKVFTELTAEQCKDYDALKAALLLSYSVVPEVYRKRFRSIRKYPKETYSEFASRLTQQFKRWSEGENAYDSVENLRQLIQIEQFREFLDQDMSVWLIDQKPKTLTDCARLADQFTAVRKHAGNDQSKNFRRKFNQSPTHADQTHTENSRNDSVSSQSTQADTAASQTRAGSESAQSHDKRSRSNGKVVCFYCKKAGHVMSICRQKLANEASKASSSINLVSTRQGSTKVRENQVISKQNSTVRVDPGYKQYCLTAALIKPDGSQKEVTLLRDTGALQSLISKQASSCDDYVDTGEYRLIRGIAGDTIRVPLVEVQFQDNRLNGKYLLGLVDRLPEGLHGLMGNDMCDSETLEILAVTRAQAAAAAAAAAQQRSVSNGAQQSAAVSQQANSAQQQQQTSASADATSDTDLDIAQLWNDSTDHVDRETLIQLQQTDPALSKLVQMASEKKSDDSSQNNSQYYFENGVLMRSYLDKTLPIGAELHQIVVPEKLKSKVLFLSHDIQFAAHLGATKTLNRITKHFYWPGIVKSVKEYCRSCDSCQRLGKGVKKTVGKLHSLPLVNEPFSRIAIDIVGPLPRCDETGNRFILTVLDLATHFPEAVAMKEHKASDVASGLLTVFSRFGFPKEILSDLGPELQSELMQIFLHEFHIKQIRTSPYHPMTNGACERFNGTMKKMLTAVCEKYKGRWDTVLPWILFAYREVPVETLGFSPFELLFGHSVSGPLSLYKSSWLSDVDLTSAKQNVIDFITDTRQNVQQAMATANEHAAEERRRSKVWYDRKARERKYEIGEEVLVLLPLLDKPLQAKYHGPYKIVQKLGPVDYVVATPDRRKQKRVCHVNLLKPYVRRNHVIHNTGSVTTVLVSETHEQHKTHIECNVDQRPLSPRYRKDVEQLQREYSDIFSDKPGKTTLCKHHIELTPGVRPIKSAPYRLNPEKVKYLKNEITDLLKDSLIEESDSSFASNVVLVKKSDNTLRLCVDYRKLNNFTLPDPFPLPRVEDLLDRVGQSNFLSKIDMTRGYWQVPLDDESIPLTAFVTPFGLFNWRVMPFGLKNAPATFCRLVTKLLKNLEDFAAAYLDDILIFSKTWNEHVNHLKQVFDRIRNAGLTLNKNKCVFGVAEIDYLGHHIGLGKVQPRENKINALVNFARPTNRKQLQSYLGLAGFYRKYLPHYADITSVLTDLLKKDVVFNWSQEAENAFLDLKSRLVSRPILCPANFDLPFHLAVDASQIATSGVLFQDHEEIEHPICYFSHKLDKHQVNYSTIEKEALGLLLAVRAFSVYFGSTPVKVYTDHNPLVFLHRMANHNQKLLRWCLELQQYNLEIIHRPANRNFFADLLSRPS